MIRHALIIIYIMYGFVNSVNAIVPKGKTPLTQYENAGKVFSDVGQLISYGKKSSSCSGTLIGTKGNIGIVLTAGHCAELKPEEQVDKCRKQVVSFSSENTYTDTKQLPVIGRLILNDYVDKFSDYQHDLGITFVDMSDLSPTDIHPIRKIEIKRELLPPKAIVNVVGYGKTSSVDNLKQTKRRAMSTQAIKLRKNEADVLLLDEDGLQVNPAMPPIGDNPAEGDSGGPIIAADSGAVIGVVSHKKGDEFFSEPLYPHSKWLKAQLEFASDCLILKPKKQSGTLSDTSNWKGGRLPARFKTAYGQINPIVQIEQNQTLILDSSATPYAINIENEGGTLRVQHQRYVEKLRINAPTQILGDTLTTDELKVSHDHVQIDSKIRVAHKLFIDSDTQVDFHNRGLKLINLGTVEIQGTLKTDHVTFAAGSNKSSQAGELRLSGTLESTVALKHFMHVVALDASSPGTIKSDYILGGSGRLTFTVDDLTHPSEPLLRIIGTASFQGGQIELHSDKTLPIGFEQTLVTADSIADNPQWKGIYSNSITPQNSEVMFFRDADNIKMKVVPLLYGNSVTTHEKNILSENVF